MANPAVNTSVCTCSFGTVPMSLSVTTQQTVTMCGQLAATIMDNVCTTFGMCSSMANPSVASATAAAMGALTPMPCTPVIPAPWTPGSPTVQVCSQLVLNKNCTLACAYGGVIQITMTPAATVQVPG